MSEQERDRRQNELSRLGDSVSEGGSEDEEGTEASEFHDQANALLRASEQIIQRALTGDSLEFLRANRQQGGQ